MKWSCHRIAIASCGLLCRCCCLAIGLTTAGSLCLAADGVELPTREDQQAADESIHEAALRGHVRFLADDLLEGRRTGNQRGFVGPALHCRSIRVTGIQTGGTRWRLVSASSAGRYHDASAEMVTFHHGDDALALRRHEDFVFNSGKPVEKAGVEDAELVFVGYGIVAPEFNWNDFQGVDVKGKVLLIMNDDPSSDPNLFAGKRRLYYGRWDYKYEMAARQGAAGAIIIHTTESAGYPFRVVQTSWTGEEFELRDTPGPRVELRGWLTEDAARRVVQLSGHDLDKLRAAAQDKSFRPVSLGTRFSLGLACKIRQQDTANVLALLPGSDADLAQEMIVYTAHHDHLGLAIEPDSRGDRICNGAVDNASGVAGLLAIARAYADTERPPRSILFASVAAEEQGLLGSQHLARNPPVAAGYLAAVVNIDGLNIFGPTRDIQLISSGKSSLDQIVERIATWQQRVVTPDQFPSRGYYYRSDQFSLAKIGVPGVYLHSGTNVIGRPEGWGKQQLDEWIETRYHQPSDEYGDDWNLSGAVDDMRLLFYTGLLAARHAPIAVAGIRVTNSNPPARRHSGHAAHRIERAATGEAAACLTCKHSRA